MNDNQSKKRPGLGSKKQPKEQEALNFSLINSSMLNESLLDG